MSRHKCTSHVCGRTHECKSKRRREKEVGNGKIKVRGRGGSTNEPVTSVDRLTSTMTGGRRECTCHVCGQTHPVSDTAIKTSAGYTRKTKKKDEKRGGEKGDECTCHVYGQTHRKTKKRKGNAQNKEREKGAERKSSTKKEGGESTSAPVTSADRHTSTKKQISGQEL